MAHGCSLFEEAVAAGGGGGPDGSRPPPPPPPPPGAAAIACLLTHLVLHMSHAVPQGNLGRFLSDPPAETLGGSEVSTGAAPASSGGGGGGLPDPEFTVLERTMRALAALVGDVGEGGWGGGSGEWYSLRLCCVRLLLAMASPLLYSTETTSPPGVCPFYDCLLHDRGSAGDPCSPTPLARLLGGLLGAFAEGPRPPRGTQLPPGPGPAPGVGGAGEDGAQGGGPGVGGGQTPPAKARLASSVLGLPSRALRAVVGQTRQLALGGAPEGWGASPLGDASTLLALLLLHYTPQGQIPPRQLLVGTTQTVGHNPAKEILAQAQDTSLVGEFGQVSSRGRSGAGAGARAGAGAEAVGSAGRPVGTAPPEGKGGGGQVPVQPPLALDFTQLYLRLGEALGSPESRERTTLLLYGLLHECPAFRHWVTLRSDGDKLVLPLLQALYEVRLGQTRQSYVILTVLLMLTQDPGFTSDVQALEVRRVAFYRECPLAGVSLGSVAVIVLVRAVRRNLAGGRDLYMHTNCLAALANLAPHLQGLSGYACQRLFSLFGSLARIYLRLHEDAEAAPSDGGTRDVAVYEDFLRTLLEVFNVLILRRLTANPHFVYGLLHSQAAFQPLQGLPQFQHLMENVHIALDFFNLRLDRLISSGAATTSEVMLRAVEAECDAWHTKGLREMPDPHFTYEQEGNAQDFFVPYVWQLLMDQGGLPVDRGLVILVAPEPAPGSEGGADASKPDPSLSLEQPARAAPEGGDSLDSVV